MVGIPLTMIVALVLAVALNSGIEKFRTVFRVGFYTPVVTSIVAVAVVWKFILQHDGLLNTVLSWVGITGPDWLNSTTWAMPALIMMAVWRNMGTLMIIFLAGLQTIPEDIKEAAAIDGANAWQRFTQDHPAVAAADPAARRGAAVRRVPAVLRGTLRDDQGRTAGFDPVDQLLHLQPVRFRQVRLRIGGQLRAVRRDRPAEPGPVPRPAIKGLRRPAHDDFRRHPIALEPGGRPVAKPTNGTPTRLPRRRLLTYVLLVIAVVATLLPFVWMLLGSLKTDGEILRNPSGFLPQDPTLDNYATWFTDLNISTFFVNSLIVAVFTVLGNLLFCSMIGYALAKMEFAGKRVLFLLVMLTLMVPGVVTFVPLFVLVSKIGLAQHLSGADPAVPDLAARRLPDAAVHDGHPGFADRGGPDRRGRRVPDLLPGGDAAVRPAAGHPRHPDLPRLLEQLPLAAGRRAERGDVHPAGRAVAVLHRENATNYGLLLAGSVLVIAPIVLLFVLLQRFFIQSVATAGIK